MAAGLWLSHRASLRPPATTSAPTREHNGREMEFCQRRSQRCKMTLRKSNSGVSSQTHRDNPQTKVSAVFPASTFSQRNEAAGSSSLRIIQKNRDIVSVGKMLLCLGELDSFVKNGLFFLDIPRVHSVFFVFTPVNC